MLRELRLGDAGRGPARDAVGAAALAVRDASADEPRRRAAGPDDALRAALGHDPVTFDALSARTGLPADQLAARLLELELAGVVERLPGGLLQRRGRA